MRSNLRSRQAPDGAKKAEAPGQAKGKLASLSYVEPSASGRRYNAAQIAVVSEQAARAAPNQLERDGVLAQITLGRRNRAWESVGLFALVDEIERTASGGAIDAAGTH